MKLKHKKNDKVIITKAGTHKFEIGEEVKIKKLIDNNTSDAYYFAKGKDSDWCIYEGECE